MKIISMETVAALKRRLAEKDVTLHLTDACGSQSADIGYPDGMTAGERAAVRQEIETFLLRQDISVAFSKKGDSFWVRQS